ncbi:hypothetical protein [Streptomyces sp. NBC_00986]|uniref:hypothetical protein n=1 Tax=Streptomyces sp. NBC_00986 TaxID=2903702 RepID=UPI003864D0A8|nr:hypothetical protein OG504_51300 [Streptomyces sp. NBC_00986]
MRGGGQPYWNEDTQDWEDGDGGASAGRASEPPPVRPARDPVVELDRGPGTAGQSVTDPDSLDGAYPSARRPAPEWGGRPHRTWWAAGAGALVAAVVVTLVTVQLTSGSRNPHDDKSGQETAVRSGSPSTEDTTTASGAPSATDSPLADATDVPAGYRVVHDTAGFTIAVPDGWQRDERTNGVFYTIDGDRDLLQIYEVANPTGTPYEALQSTSNNRSNEEPGYEQLSLEDVTASTTAPGQDAAELVYAYDNKTLNQRRQVVDYAFTAPNGTQYAVLVAGSADEWPLQKDRLSVALAHFEAD